MVYFGAMVAAVWELINLPITLYGITFSFGQVLMFSVVASIVGFVLNELFLGD